MTKKEVSVEDKLRTLYALQLIDCKIDELRNVRGELPLEVEDLEDEVAGLESRAERLVNDIDKINVDISTKKNLIEESKGLIKKYAEQQKMFATTVSSMPYLRKLSSKSSKSN